MVAPPASNTKPQDVKEASSHAVSWLLESWTLETVLGSGSQGYVWRCRHKHDASRMAAVKMLKRTGDAVREVEAYEQLRHYKPHPNVLGVDFGWDDG